MSYGAHLILHAARLARSAGHRVQTSSLSEPMPPGLERMRPRDVRLKPAGWTLVVTVAVVMASALPAGIALELKARRDRDALQAFRDQTVEVSGIVTRKWRTSGENRPTWIAYEYEADGRTYRRDVRVSRGRWNAVDAGSPVPVHFTAGHPDQSYLWANEPGVMPAFVPYVVGASLLLTGALLTLPLISQQRMLAEGRPALATIKRHSQGHHGKMAYYEFTGLSGGRGGQGQVGPSEKPPPVGGALWVLYMPERPSHSARYPLSLVRLAHETGLSGHARKARDRGTRL